MSKKGDRILVGLSGNGASAVAALLMKSQGFDVVGVYCDTGGKPPEGWEPFDSRCLSQVSQERAERVAKSLGIPLEVVSVEEIFAHEVIDFTLHEYLKNRSPFPCVRCFSRVLLPTLLREKNRLECSRLITGHHAQLVSDPEDGRIHVQRGVEQTYDQSFYLTWLKEDQLSQIALPTGGLTRAMMERLLEEAGLEGLELKQSTGPCRMSYDSEVEWVEKRSTPDLRMRGLMRATDGRLLGDHQGLYRYRIGQSNGVKLSVQDPELSPPIVIGKDLRTQTLVIGTEKDLMQSHILVSNVNWIHPVDGLKGFSCSILFQPNAEPVEAYLLPFENQTASVRFEESQRAINPGDSLAILENGEMIGSAVVYEIIDRDLDQRREVRL